MLKTEREQIIQLLNKLVSPRRIEHILGVEQTAVELARLNGEDTKKASTAALLHDLFRDLDEKETLEIALQMGLKLDDYTKENYKVAHGPLAAHYAEQKLGIADEDILDAIKYHTVANKKMSMLSKIIYLADAIEPCRDFKEAAKLRELAKKDLEAAYRAALESTYIYIKSKGLRLHPDTLEAINQIRKDDDI